MIRGERGLFNGDVPSDLGGRVRYFRHTSGYTMKDLSKMAGITELQVWRIETGRTANPHPGTLKSLAAALGIPFSFLRDAE